MKEGWKAISVFSSVQSFVWRGKDMGLVLQDLIAQVRKLRVRSFILMGGDGVGRGRSACADWEGLAVQWHRVFVEYQIGG